MSDQIRVSTETLDTLASQLKALGSDLSDASSRLTGIGMNYTTASHVLRGGGCRLSGNAGVSGVNVGSTRSTIGRYGDALGAYEDLCRRLAGSIRQIRDRFAVAEERISALVEGNALDSDSQDNLPADPRDWTPSQWAAYTERNGDKGIDFSDGIKIYEKDGMVYFVNTDGLLIGHYDVGVPSFGPYSLELYTPFGIMSELVASETSRKFWNWFTSDGVDTGSKINLLKGKEFTFEKQHKDDDLLEPKHTFAEIGFKKAGYDALGLIEGGIEGENGNLKAKVGVGYYEGSIEGYAGIYGYDDDGNLVISPGLRGEIGGSFSVIHADMEGSYDFGPCEIGGSVSADVGKVGGKAEFQVGWVDDDFALNVGGELEAIACEVEGSVSVSNDYVGMKATGGVQVGVGVSGNVGYHDGVISIEGSLAVGLGISGKVELDISGTIDAAMDMAESIADGVQQTYEGIRAIGSLFYG